MKTLAIAIVGLFALAALPAAAVANHPAGFGMPEQSMWGLCNAYEHNAKGRENGNAGNAGPFHWLQEQVDENDQTVEEFCAQFDKPGNGQGPGQGGEPGRPDDAGPPA